MISESIWLLTSAWMASCRRFSSAAASFCFSSCFMSAAVFSGVCSTGAPAPTAAGGASALPAAPSDSTALLSGAVGFGARASCSVSNLCSARPNSLSGARSRKSRAPALQSRNVARKISLNLGSPSIKNRVMTFWKAGTKGTTLANLALMWASYCAPGACALHNSWNRSFEQGTRRKRGISPSMISACAIRVQTCRITTSCWSCCSSPKETSSSQKGAQSVP